MTTYTPDQLHALDAQVQLAQDQRLAAHLVVSGAEVPDASGPAPYPGVPEGATFAPVTFNPELLAAIVAMGGFGPPRQAGLILSGHKRALVASELLQAAEEVSRG